MFLPITRAEKGVREAHICHILKDILFFLSGVAVIFCLSIEIIINGTKILKQIC